AREAGGAAELPQRGGEVRRIAAALTGQARGAVVVAQIRRVLPVDVDAVSPDGVHQVHARGGEARAVGAVHGVGEAVAHGPAADGHQHLHVRVVAVALVDQVLRVGLPARLGDVAGIDERALVAAVDAHEGQVDVRDLRPGHAGG